jgi:hypothetical protein
MNMHRLKYVFSKSIIASGWSAITFGFVALVVLLGGAGVAAADLGCDQLGGVINGLGQCEVSGSHTPGVSTVSLGETLHIVSGGTLKVPTGITVNITAGDFIMDDGALIDGNGSPNGAPITVALSNGNVNLQTGSIVRSNGKAGGFIQITTGASGIADIDGTVESVGTNTGTGASQLPGGGPITIKAGCALTISDTGYVSSRGLDPGADLVHLEGCVVNVFGRVESTGPGHAIPNNPANSCSDRPTNVARRNPVTRPSASVPGEPGKPQNSTGCVEIWAGTSLTIDATGTHTGEVNADIGTFGGPQGLGWIELLANGQISIIDGPGNDRSFAINGTTIHTTFAVHANGGLAQGTDDGGLVIIKSLTDDVTATGDAIQADAISAGSNGGTIIVEALKSIAFDGTGASIFARGDFNGTGGFGVGGKIGLLTQPIRAFTGFLDWPLGDGDVRPTGNAVLLAQRGQINLRACTGVTATAMFPVNGLVVLPYPNILGPLCTGSPLLPVYATPFPAANCLATLCAPPSGAKKSGQKYNDLNGDGIKDPGDPGLPNWTIKVFNPVTLAEVASTTTDASGNYEFDLDPGTYVVCEGLLANWNQTFPQAGAGIVSCASFGAGLAPLGYQITLLSGDNDTGNDFGNHLAPPVCTEDPKAVCDWSVDGIGGACTAADPHCDHLADPNDPGHSAYAKAQNGQTICMFTNIVENSKLNDVKTLKITQCQQAKITAADSSQPVVTITSTGVLIIVGPDTIGGTVGWDVVSSDNELRGVRANGASECGIKIEGDRNRVSWNSVDHNQVGICVTGNQNDLRGGTVELNKGDGVQFAATASNNALRGATAQKNGGNGISVAGSLNTIRDNARVDNNALNGILVTGGSNPIKSNTAGSSAGKGNTGAGFKITGSNNTLDSNQANYNGSGFKVNGNANTLTSNVANSNFGIGFDLNGADNRLQNDQSNQGAQGGSKENAGCEYKFADGTTFDLGGNKKDKQAFAGAGAPKRYPAGCNE